jgi:predicted oxidoreductase (fatty acid repression mutant protein)
MDPNKTITITFSERVENHVGMQQIGQLAQSGFTTDQLKTIKKQLDKKKISCTIYNLHDALKDNKDQIKEQVEATILVIKNGMSLFAADNISLYNELIKLDYDKKAFMCGRVVNKNARYNLCFSDNQQKADYENGKGTIIAFNSIQNVKNIRDNLHKHFGSIATNLHAEVNYYYNINKTGIGYHGDAERKVVIGVRQGASLPLYYIWYKGHERVSDKIKIDLDHGDIYIMSEKATGNDFKRSSILTLRHATGCSKYTK